MMNVTLFYAFLILTCGYALWRGGAPERAAAAIFISATALTVLFVSGARPGFKTMETGVLVVDAFMFLAFLALALASTRYWPLWMTALQAVQVAGHLARISDPKMIPWLYAVAMSIWCYPMMLLLVTATGRHRERVRQNGADAPWRHFWRSSMPTVPPIGREP